MSPPLNSLPLLASLSPPNQVRSDPKAPRTPALVLIAYSVAINVFVLARFLRAQMTLGLFLYLFFRAFAAYMTTLGLSTLFNYFLSVSNVQKILSVFESCHAPAEFSGGGGEGTNSLMFTFTHEQHFVLTQSPWDTVFQ